MLGQKILKGVEGVLCELTMLFFGGRKTKRWGCMRDETIDIQEILMLGTEVPWKGENENTERRQDKLEEIRMGVQRMAGLYPPKKKSK